MLACVCSLLHRALPWLISCFRQFKINNSAPYTLKSSLVNFNPILNTLYSPNIGQIRRLATGLVKGFRRFPNEERLRRLGLHSLNRNRLCGDLIAAYGVFSGGLDMDPILFLFRQCGQASKILQGRHLLYTSPHFFCSRPFSQLFQTATRFNIGGFVFNSLVIPPTQITLFLFALSYSLNNNLLTCITTQTLKLLSIL